MPDLPAAIGVETIRYDSRNITRYRLTASIGIGNCIPIRRSPIPTEARPNRAAAFEQSEQGRRIKWS